MPDLFGWLLNKKTSTNQFAVAVGAHENDVAMSKNITLRYNTTWVYLLRFGVLRRRVVLKVRDSDILILPRRKTPPKLDLRTQVMYMQCGLHVIELFASGGALLLLDQWSKRTAHTRAADRHIAWGPILRIRYVAHRTSVYRRGSRRALLVVVWLTALVSAILLHHWGTWFQSRCAVLGLGLAFGGAAGNLLDMLRHRHVVDFVDLRWWPVFNLADVAIVFGLAAAFLSQT